MDVSKARLRWQCRRGMRELDVLLTRYLDACYDTADAAEKEAFAQLLTMSDPELIGYLLQGQDAELELVDVVRRILDGPDP